jgi:AcrR family transcriptional regulator
MAARRSQEQRSEASIERALNAALELFSTQGFRATTMRQIADRAALSVGNIYHHFPDKEAIYDRLIERYWERLLDPANELNEIFARADFPDDLEELAAAIERTVEANKEHILLIYLDVIEFRGEHVRAFYDGMSERFERTYGPRFAERRAAGEFGDVDPMLAVMVATRWLFYFYTVEKCFGVPMHFGMTPKQAVDGFIQLVRHGLASPTSEAPPAPIPNERRSAQARPAARKRSRTARGGKK